MNMRVLSLVASGFFLVARVIASTNDRYEIFESLATAPKGWILESEPAASDELYMRVHLKQQNVQEFEEKLINISTPGHPEYGKHMSSAAIKMMLQPSDDSIVNVRKWLESHDLEKDAREEADWMYVRTTVEKAERLLDTKYFIFRDLETGTKQARTLSYSVPGSIKNHINMIHPTTSFVKARPLGSTVHYYQRPAPANIDIAASCSSSITPTCLADLYSYGNYTPTAIKAKMGVAGFLEQWPQKSDLSKFLKKYDAPIAGTTFPCVLINGGVCNTTTNENNIVEANLDIQYAVAISGKVPVTYYSTGGRPPILGGGTNDNEPYLEFLNYLMSLASNALPTTVSISYGDVENSVPPSYASTVCNLFSQVGARGVSFLAASGDGGADCSVSGGKDVLSPIFPGGCSFITTVGGTVGVSPERAVDFSGGGFSNYFSQPSYQSSAVQAWLAGKHDTGITALVNTSGRAFPDVSAQGSNFHVILAGSDSLVGGTSAATPTFASVINLVNNELLARGKSPLGFLNPFLYGAGRTGLTDITAGSNEGCSNINGGVGFEAVQGWDPVTGLGTPSFTKLLSLALAA